MYMRFEVLSAVLVGCDAVLLSEGCRRCEETVPSPGRVSIPRRTTFVLTLTISEARGHYDKVAERKSNEAAHIVVTEHTE